MWSGQKTATLVTPQISNRQRTPIYRTSVPLLSRSSIKAVASSVEYSVRQGNQEDSKAIKDWLWDEKLNPMGIVPERFLILEDDMKNMLACGQLQEFQEDGKNVFELRSIVVSKQSRGRGVGVALVKHLLEKAGPQPVYLVTIGKRANFYEQSGFRILEKFEDVPKFLRPEYFLGVVVARIVANDKLIAMVHDKT